MSKKASKARTNRNKPQLQTKDSMHKVAGASATHSPPSVSHPKTEADIYALIGKLIKDQGQYAFPEHTRVNSQKYVRILSIPVKFIVLICLLQIFSDLLEGTSVPLTLIAYPFTGIAMLQYLSIPNRKGPAQSVELDKWRWKQGRERFLWLLLFAISGTFTVLYEQIFRPREDYWASLTILLIILCVAIFCGTLFLVLLRPRWFTSIVLDAAYAFSAVLGVFLMASRIIERFSPGWLSASKLVAGFLICVYLLYHYVKARGKNKSKLSMFQLEAINLVGPDRLFEKLRTKYQILEDRLKAMEAYTHLVKQYPIGVRAELIKLIAIEGDAKSSRLLWWAIGIGISLATFIVGAVAEAGFQDAIYEPFVKPLLCQFSILTDCLP